jgi:hypothetical protein
MHPILVTALAEDQRRHCPCGAITQLPYRLCRDCRRQHTEMPGHTSAPPRRSPLNARLFRNAPPIALVRSLLQHISKARQG